MLDYNEEYRSAGQLTSLYSEDAYRSSDHDPVIVGLELAVELPYRVYLPLVSRSWLPRNLLRRAYEWTILAENRWPRDGRKLTHG